MDVLPFDQISDEIDALSRNPDVLDRVTSWFRAVEGLATGRGCSANLSLFSETAKLAVYSLETGLAESCSEVWLWIASVLF